jgi:hypothetical protein
VSGPHVVEIEVVAGSSHSASVKIDGVEHHNAITAYTIEHVAGERPTIVTLDLAEGVMFEHFRWRDRCNVKVGESTWALLERLGWTPPDEHREEMLPI